MKKLLSFITVFAIIIANVTIIPLLSVSANAAETTEGDYEIVYNSGDRIIVSLGDSYSSGEGIDPFFGSELPINERVNNADWLCHRSKNAWSGKLTLENSDGTTITMKEHRGNADTDGNWYFAAMSGAVTGNILDTDPIPEKDKDKKEYEHRFKKYKKLTNVKINLLKPLVPILEFLEGSVEIEPQLNVFQQLGDKKADYVTITMGGNDIDFTGIVIQAAINVPFLEYSSLDINLIEKQPISKWVLSSKLEKMVNEVLPITKERLEESYKRIAEQAGSQAHIIVAGYPKIISINSKNAIFTKEDAELINSKVSYFNDEIRSAVEKCQRDGINISFVSVEDKFGDYGAYYPDTNKELINRLKTVQSQDICEIPPISSYSIHPNEKGAEAYADCVQKEIEQVEENRTRIWGQVVDVSNKPISGVKVTLTDGDNKVHKTNTSDTNGNYGFELDYQEGRHYTVKFESKDYKTLVVNEEKGGNRITINTKLKKEIQTSNIDSAWKSIYKAKLQEKAKEYSGSEYDPKFELIDVDQNGIPELFISQGTYRISVCEVYTINDGEIKQLSVASMYGMLNYNSKEKLLGDVHVYAGSSVLYWVGKLANGEIEEVYSSQSHDDTFIVNGEEVTLEEYNEANSKYPIQGGSDWTGVGRKYSLNSKEIDAILGTSYDQKTELSNTDNKKSNWDDYVSLLNEFVSSGKWAKLSETEIQNTNSLFSSEFINYNDIRNPDEWSITDGNKHIFDMDDDGIPEMILKIESSVYKVGPTGPASNTEFVAIKDGKATILMNAYWTGGSMQGDSIGICKNITDNKYYVAYYSHEHIDAGNNNSSITYYDYLSGNVKETHYIGKNVSYDWSSRNSEPTIACTIDGRDVSETEYNNLSSSFSNVSNEDLPK